MFKSLTALAAVLLLTAPQAQAQIQTQTQTRSSASAPVIIKGTLRPKPAEAEAPPPLDIFVKPPRVELTALSSDGSRFAFVTHKGGSRLLTVYNVSDGTNQVIRLSEDPLSALTFLDNEHIVLSQTQTGVRGTCPGGAEHVSKAAQAVSDLNAAMSVSGFNGGSGTDVTSPDPILALILASVLNPPPCLSYGVRAGEAATVVDLRSSKSVSLGSRLAGDYDHLPLGLPKPVMVDGKLMLVGPFLELRDKSIGGTAAQRAYLWRVNPDTGRGRIIDDKGGDLDRQGSYVDDWLTDDAGQPTVRTNYTYGTETFTIEARKDGKWSPILKRKINAKAHTVAPFLAGLGRDGQSVLIVDAVANADGPKHFRYFELSLDGKLTEVAESSDATRDRPILDPETGVLAGFAHDGEITTYTFFDDTLADVYKHALDTAPSRTVRIAALGRDPRQMILFDQGGDDLGAWHYYDFATGKRVDIGNQYPSIPDEWVASQRSIAYKAADGLEITALMTLPPKGEPKHRALVVLPHDGPLAHDRRGYDWLAQALASRGYVVLQPNYRGSDGGDQALTDAGNGQWAGRSLSDIADGVRYLTAQGIADPKRVCIAGQGYGGYAALSGAQSGSPYRCAISINGIADPGDYADTAKGNSVADDIAALKADPQLPRAFTADPASPALVQRSFGSQTPPAIAASSVSVPVLLVTSQWDKTVSPGQSRSLRDRLQKAGKPVTYVELPDCRHDLGTEACKLGAAQAVVDFLATQNPAR